MKNTCPNDIFTCPKKKKSYILCIESRRPQYTFDLPDSGNCYFLVFQNACPNQTFTWPGNRASALNVAP